MDRCADRCWLLGLGSAVTALPSRPRPDLWRARRDKAERQHGNAKYPQRQLELAVAAQIKRANREDDKKQKASNA